MSTVVENQFLITNCCISFNFICAYKIGGNAFVSAVEGSLIHQRPTIFFDFKKTNLRLALDQ